VAEGPQADLRCDRRAGGWTVVPSPYVAVGQ